MDNMTLQYIIIALAFAGACFYIFTKMKKKLIAPKNKNGKNCDTNCGCS